jgi:hypothetical protein
MAFPPIFWSTKFGQNFPKMFFDQIYIREKKLQWNPKFFVLKKHCAKCEK